MQIGRQYVPREWGHGSVECCSTVGTSVWGAVSRQVSEAGMAYFGTTYPVRARTRAPGYRVAASPASSTRMLRVLPGVPSGWT